MLASCTVTSQEYALARIRSLNQATGTGKLHPTEVDATWTTASGSDGEQLLQISTFGSDLRASEPKVSQTIQIDGELAQELRIVLDLLFPPSK